eukprot:scaffold133_cov407-Prasinococcus_capsulatus_cf.AAC.13
MAAAGAMLCPVACATVRASASAHGTASPQAPCPPEATSPRESCQRARLPPSLPRLLKSDWEGGADQVTSCSHLLPPSLSDHSPQ